MRCARFAGLMVVALISFSLIGTSLAASCHNSGNFENWLTEFKREAAAQGISQRAITAASPGMIYDQRIVNIDRGQRVFNQTFLEFSTRMVASYRIQKGAQLIQQHAAIFQRVQQQYGVPAAVIVAFWGLESDFGLNMGKEQSLKALTTLAYDCRRGDMFRGQLLDALRLIERGDIRPEEMIGSWAGEIGQTQMMPTEYNKYAVDFDGDGRRDLLKSVPDVLASAGNYIQSLGWQRGQPWLREVRVSANVPWDQADLNIQHPHSQWTLWGVTGADGRPLPAEAPPASLILPMGRFGPAFLVYPNFQVYLKWNQSLVYSLTAAYYATRLSGAGPMQKGSGAPPPLSFEQAKDLQRMLARYGYTGEIDGKLGISTRMAIKAAQTKVGLPADSYPTVELLERLRGGP
jgi:lytic murein transglycosylase